MSKARKFAVESFAESLLPVPTAWKPAWRSRTPPRSRSAKAPQATLRQLTSALERNKVIEINPARAPSSTRISTRPSAWCRAHRIPQEANTVVSVLQKGYLIAERVLRPALVTVAAPQVRRPGLETATAYPQVTHRI